MKPEKIVDVAIRGMKRDQEDVYPGLSKLIRVLSRIAPNFLIGRQAKRAEIFIPRIKAIVAGTAMNINMNEYVLGWKRIAFLTTLCW